ncbi:uncharacterized protein SOCEGT47_029540 [Sorangium cellulosum]|uniref:Protein kinase domain-containing protein n=1 Tax=Sorangium cellulosum TaxID=56 RepID=A0A4P2Q096_SORCE|nr:protein kinase [Sorangium cellulosum]AUX22451.1 uncharacterized protein SOCEGT47_029540 [Sorangium cellulosum]
MEALIRPGSVLLGKYRVESVLGKGGMGVVVAARHLDLDELRAIKILLPEALRDPHAEERFLGEADNASRLGGEHVARVHELGRLPTGELLIVIELLSGADPRQIVQAGDPLPVEDAATSALQASTALAEAHALGIIHRDMPGDPASPPPATTPAGPPQVVPEGPPEEVVSTGSAWDQTGAPGRSMAGHRARALASAALGVSAISAYLSWFTLYAEADRGHARAAASFSVSAPAASWLHDPESSSPEAVEAPPSSAPPPAGVGKASSATSSTQERHPPGTPASPPTSESASSPRGAGARSDLVIGISKTARAASVPPERTHEPLR